MNTHETRERLQSIADDNFAIPQGLNPSEMIPELIKALGSLDQIVRERSYEILEIWSVRRQFNDEVLRNLGDQLAGNLGVGIGETMSDSVFTRSYAALALCGPIAADELSIGGFHENREGFLSSEQVHRWLGQALASFREEMDLRPFVDGKGWADAIGHKGDLLHVFARSPHIKADELEKILHTVRDRLHCSSTKVFVHDEGHRVMRPVYSALLRDEIPLENVTSWIESFSTTSDGRDWGWGSLFSLEHCDSPAVVVRTNVREALRDFQVHLQFGMRRQKSEDRLTNAYNAYYDRPVPNQEELLVSVDCVLRILYKGVYPSEASP